MHLLNQQLFLMTQGKFNEAFEISKKLLKKNPNDARAKFNAGWHYIHQGDFITGYQLLEAGRTINVYGDAPLLTTKPIWTGQPLTDKTVVLKLEGGYGDNFIQLRTAKDIVAAGGKPIIYCDKGLHNLFSKTPEVTKCITYNEINRTHFDYWIPGFSGTTLFKHSKDSINNKRYIFSDIDKNKKWKFFFEKDPKIKIGIKWSGNPKFEHQQFRLFPIDYLIELTEKFNFVQFYSLQRDHHLIELPKNIIDLKEQLNSWDETAACVNNLDLVISSCTSIVHLSGAMGKQTFVIVPLLPYHIWAYCKKQSLWYENTTIYKQKIPNSWQEPFQELENDLELFLLNYKK